MSGWASLPETFDQQGRQVSVVQDADQQLDETLDDSQPTTRKIRFFSIGVYAKRIGQRSHL